MTETLTVLAENSEKFKSISFENFRIMDSMAHLPSSLATLTSNLVKKCIVNGSVDLHAARGNFHYLSKEFPDDSQFKFLLRKGVFPYQWFDSPEKLQERSLPSQDAFYNDLNDEPCSDADYQHAREVGLCSVENF